MASTPSTDSEPEPAEGRYRFDFSWPSPYGHAVTLLTRLAAKPGLVLDLGCGFGPVAETLVDEGYEYVGLDIDAAALADLAERGMETHELDLADATALPGKLKRIAGDRRVTGILLLDVIEHFAETRELLRAVRTAMGELERPVLVVSVPNVAHIDVSSKLAFGLWDRTPTGLLDETHLQLFTAARLTATMHDCGLIEVAENDFPLVLSDQHFPPAHPALAAGSPVAQLLRRWRAAADEHGSTNQFVRAFLSHDIDAGAADEAASPPQVLSVVMRTQGRRIANLREALTCLAAQTVDDFDVLLMFHSDDADDLDVVRAIVAEFDPRFGDRITVVPVTGGGRARPLNEALDRARGEYVAFLDDDDLVMAHWVEAFAGAAGDGVIVRSQSVIRRVSLAPPGSHATYQPESGLEACFEADFNLARHFWNNQTPICSFAVPRKLLDVFGLRFDDGLAVLEDWEFLMRCVTLAAVRDTGEITSIYHRWTNSESSASLHDQDLWAAVHQLVLNRLDREPLVFPRGTASSLAGVWSTLDRVRAELHESRLEAGAARHEITMLAGERDWLRNRYDLVIRSRRWRALGPLAAAIANLRASLRLRVRGHAD